MVVQGYLTDRIQSYFFSNTERTRCLFSEVGTAGIIEEVVSEQFSKKKTMITATALFSNKESNFYERRKKYLVSGCFRVYLYASVFITMYS